ncbi:MAG: hypothetical protein AB1861_04955 [Cyanobacteriota bacterium]
MIASVTSNWHIPSKIAPSGLLCLCQVLLKSFFKNFRGLNGYNASPVLVQGIESGNAPPSIALKLLHPPTLPGDRITARLAYPQKSDLLKAAALRDRFQPLLIPTQSSN